LSASDFIWALVSGLPKSERERRPIMALQQTFIDDSGSDPNSFVFVLAGFCATPVQWAAFTDDWVKALAISPSLDYFKHNEAMGMKGQFDKNRGWTEQMRDNRLIALTNVITAHIPERFSVAIKHADYKRYLHGIPVEKRSKNLEDPYFILFYDMMITVAGVHSLSNEVVPCEFVFDQQGKIGDRAAAWWSTFRQGLTQAKFDLSPYLTESKPSFKSDKEVRPLQAADLHAGQLARMMASDKIIIPMSPIMRHLMTLSGYHRVLSHDYLYPLRERFLSMATAIDKQDPDRLKYVLGRPTTKRKKP
jgi:hypothetical protein